MEKPSRKSLIAAAVLVFVVVLLIRTFVVEGFVVRGDSMAPTILSGDYVFVNKLAYKFLEPRRGDIVVAYPREFSSKVLKRIIALPGERFEIEEGKVTIRDKRTDARKPLQEIYLNTQNTPEVGTTYIRLDPYEYFALGDNREVSVDSRELGPVDKWDIKGKVFGVISLRRFFYQGL